LYVDGRIARLPLRLPIRPLTASELETRLTTGDRRQGLLLYRTACPTCRACEPIRIDATEFIANRTQKRTFARGERQIESELGPLEATPEKVALYNRHKGGRQLSTGESPLGLTSYRAFLGESCCDSFEIRYRSQGRLIGVAVTDRAANSLSAVYCYFDPAYSKFSPGTYSILKQLDLCRQWGLQHLYLGLHIAECRAMTYKAGFSPHERRINGQWTRFDRVHANDDDAR
jgi:arginine-tRNA-protein transferase